MADTKSRVFCVTSFDSKETAGTDSSIGKSQIFREFFSENSKADQLRLRAALGPSVYVGTFDIQAFNYEAPLGTSIFQLAKEREYASRNRVMLDSRFWTTVNKSQSKLTAD